MDFISTALPIAERASGYRQALRQYFAYLDPDVRIEVETDEPEHFDARIEHIALGHLRGAIHHCNSPHRLHVPRPTLRALDLYVVHEGDMTLNGPEGSVALRAGDMVLWQTGVEWESASARFDMIAFGLPESVIRDRALDPRWAIGRRIPGTSALAVCIRALLRKAAEHHRQLALEEGAVLEKALLDAVHSEPVIEPLALDAHLVRSELFRPERGDVLDGHRLRVESACLSSGRRARRSASG